MDYHDLLHNPSFSSVLLQIDADVAHECKGEGCKKCGGGVLHKSDFFRSLGFGITKASDKEARRRQSFTCGKEGCRRRTTPPSLRFTRGVWFMSVVIVLLSAMQHGMTPERRAELQRRLGVSRQTLDRWRKWWLKIFTSSPAWRIWRARCPMGDDERQPDGLLRYFLESTTSRFQTLVLTCALVGACHMDDPGSVFTIVQARLRDHKNPQSMCGDVEEKNP